MNTRLLVLVVALCLLAVSAWGKVPGGAVGSVVAVRGEVKAVDSKQAERPLVAKSEIFQSDTIRTGKGGRVQLLFEDNTIVNLGDNSVMEVARYEWDANKQTGAMKTRVEEGTFRVLGGLITKNSPKNFTTETPAATIGIRGSMYAGTYRHNLLKVAFLGGKGIYVNNPHGRVEIDRPGFGTRVNLGGPPDTPFRMQGPEVGALMGGEDDGTGTGTGGQATDGTGGTGTAGTGSDSGSGDGTGLSPENADLLDPGTGGPTDTTTLDVAVALLNDFTVNFSNDQTYSLIREALYVPAPATPGQFFHYLRRLSDGAVVDAGRFDLKSSFANGTIVLSYADGTVLQQFPTALYTPTPSPSYTSWDWWVVGEPVVVNTAVGAIATTMDLAWDDKLEFAVLEYNFPGDIANAGGIDYIYQGFAYDGIPTALSSLPTSGVDTYWGDTMGVEMYPDTYAAFDNVMAEASMAVNWANRKVLGTVYDMGSFGPYPVDHVHFYGDLNAGPASFQIVSGEGWTGPFFSDPWTSSGIMATGQFFGSEYQGFGFTATGTDYRLADMSQGPFQVIGGLFREPGLTTASPAGVKNWSGFYVGTSDNIVSPTYTTIHQNIFSLVLDANSGNVTGNWLYNPVGYPVTIPLGGAGNSAYVDDQQFIAEFVPGTYTNMMSVTVKPEGSFLVTADPGYQFSDYASWGYWNMVYNGTQQFHSPGSFWVAGESTLASVIDSYRTSGLAATYVGPAYGVQIDAGNNMTPLTGGNTNLTVLFGSSFISGQIGFDQATLNVAGPATISGSTITYNSTGPPMSLQGGFYGPNAETMAGTFQANVGANRYSGTFGGNGTPVLP